MLIFSKRRTEPLTTLITTPRLHLCHLQEDDDDFILSLLNDPDWLRHIGDRGVRDAAGARRYLRDGPMRMYRERGFGLYRMDRRTDGRPMGICGLIKRPQLDDVDLGYALLPAYRGCGYAREAAMATLTHGRDELGLNRIVAITSLDNQPSIDLLQSVGMVFQRVVHLDDDDPGSRLFLWQADKVVPSVAHDERGETHRG